MSLHPTMSDQELDYVLDAIRELVERQEWCDDYRYDPHTNEFNHVSFPTKVEEDFRAWVKLDGK